jgi:hypothetical protein
MIAYLLANRLNPKAHLARNRSYLTFGACEAAAESYSEHAAEWTQRWVLLWGWRSLEAIDASRKCIIGGLAESGGTVLATEFKKTPRRTALRRAVVAHGTAGPSEGKNSPEHTAVAARKRLWGATRRRIARGRAPRTDRENATAESAPDPVEVAGGQ